MEPNYTFFIIGFGSIDIFIDKYCYPKKFIKTKHFSRRMGSNHDRIDYFRKVVEVQAPLASWGLYVFIFLEVWAPGHIV